MVCPVLTPTFKSLVVGAFMRATQLIMKLPMAAVGLGAMVLIGQRRKNGRHHKKNCRA